jgi:DtxR family transcriptional regulator, Mn-dependent transcriptional regulator
VPTPTTEDYIKNIYKLQAEGGAVTTSALAAALRLADASVTIKVKKMAAQRLVRYRRYRGVELTAAGERMALTILRRHRLWEMYLVTFLGFAWDEIHPEAERLEHATSRALERRLDARLGFPRFDPHGDPIPDAEGDMARPAARPLAECSAGARLRVCRVQDGSSPILRAAARLGLAPGSRLTVIGRGRAEGSIAVRIAGRRRSVTGAVAEAVSVALE